MPKTQLTKTQQEMIVKNDKLIKKFVHRYFPNEKWETKQELIQEGLAIVCDKIGTFNPQKGAYSTWLYTVLGFLLRNYHNKEKYDKSMTVEVRRKDADDDNNDFISIWAAKTSNEVYTPHRPTSIEKMMDIDKLHDKIDLLEDIEKKVVMMFMSDYSPKEISDVCGITQNQIYYVKDKALQKLKTWMKRR